MTYWPVSAPLQGLIDDIYVARADGPAYRGLAGALLPQVEWRLAGQCAWQGRDGIVQPMPVAGAFGPSTAALHVETTGTTVIVGFGLYPEGWSALMPISAGSAIDRALDLQTLWGADARELTGLDPAQPDADLASAVDRYMLARLSHAPQPDPRIAIITEWANGPEHDLDALTERLGLSHRHAQRLTLAACGLPPRHLANKHKILRVAAALALGIDLRRDTWSAAYADQSHFIRNFKRFVGTTPTRFLRDPDILVRDVMRARFAIASPHPLGLAIPADATGHPSDSSDLPRPTPAD